MANQQLIDYIKQQIKEGVNNADIKNALLQNNWSGVDIDEAFSILQTPTSTPSAPTPPPVAPNLSAKVEDEPLVKGQRQLHPRAIWLFFFNSIIAWIFIGGYVAIQIAFIASDAGKEPGNFFSWTFFVWFIIIFIAILILAYIVAKLSYRFYRFELVDGEYKAERGIIWKRYVSIPYERIQNVDIYRGVLDRLLGLSVLNIQTAGYSAVGGKGGSEGRLPGLGRGAW